jgi:hypothetical protein
VGTSAVVGFLTGGFWGEDKVAVFHRVRLILSLLCAMCETAFYAGVLKRFGARIGLFTFLGLLTSAGMLQAAPAFLPSAFAFIAHGILRGEATLVHCNAGVSRSGSVVVSFLSAAVPLASILATGTFSMARARAAPGWLQELMGRMLYHNN